MIKITNLDLTPMLGRILGTTYTTGTDTGLTDTDTGAVLTTVATATTTTERERLSLLLNSETPKVAPMPRLSPGMDTMVITVMDTVPMDTDTMDTVLTDMLIGVRGKPRRTYLPTLLFYASFCKTIFFEKQLRFV